MRVLVTCVLLTVLVPSVSSQELSPTASPENAVFQIITYDRDPASDGLFHGHGFGTGFFIDADGTALTASHVTYSAVAHPQQYRLLAVVGKEFYDATVLCSSRLPYNPETQKKGLGVPWGRDVAKIKVEPSTAFEGRKDTLYYSLRGGTVIAWARAHTGPLPRFPFLTLDGAPGQRVHIIGYGRISVMPYKWTTDGEVTRTFLAPDGTPLFDVESTNPPVPGDSGAPVLNERNQVVGLWAWHSITNPTLGTAERAEVLRDPCH
jgi:V8-like Glu-specific endopeptidase